jgi:signal transduction histidine kinase
VRFREEIVQFALETVAPHAERRGSRITLDLPAAEIVLRADPELLRVVCVNLLDNAVKYGFDAIEVKVTARVEEGRLVFSVRNAGIGFGVEQGQKLFQRFSRLRQKGTEDRRGTGLGLYIAWWIAEKHGGKLTARSEPGEWAEFTLILPGAKVAGQ